MTNSITRQIHVCFSKLMSCSSSPFTHDRSLQDMPDEEDSAPSSSSSSPAAVFKNVYNSLYDPAAAAPSFSLPSPSSSSDTHPPSNSATFTTTTTTSATAAAAADSDDSTDAEVLSSAIASRRLLPPSSPGLSNAIADPSAFTFGVGVAVPTYSPDPYGDFRRSMEEMAAAMGLLGPEGSVVAARRRRERLYELLLCYLALNRRHAHKFIVGAFTDFLVGIAEGAEAGEEGEEEKEEGRTGQ
ncbi:hypothetical protein Taro_026375 [Colocasia esculenta]|uniref:Transcription repressor n=1 Tax=Colocasia esculenta TaxID=4460 RepID=A0A843VKE1_COLES|nr:hypothetical protein [Colocasia esculenta]